MPRRHCGSSEGSSVEEGTIVRIAIVKGIVDTSIDLELLVGLTDGTELRTA
jgi:hypothetical protein